MRTPRIGLVLVGLMLVWNLPVKAQLRFGVHAGATYSTIIGGSYNSDYRPGFVVGGRAQRDFTPVVALAAEVNFAMMGANNIRPPSTSGLPSYGKLEVQQIDVPLLFTGTLPLDSPMLVAFSFGVKTSINLGCKLDGVSCPSGAVKGVSLGLPVGGSIGWNVGSGGLYFDFRWTLSLTDYFANTVAPDQSAFQGVVRYMF